MKRKARRVASLSIASLLMLAPAVLASDTNQSDLRDTAGRFDVVAVELRHGVDSGRWDTRMARTWTLSEAWDAGYVFVYFDTKGGPDADFYVLIRSTGRGLKGSLYRDSAVGKDPRIGAVEARRPSPKTARFNLSLVRLEIADTRTEWFWSVQTLWTSGTCPHVCSDLVPDSGSIAQPVETAAVLAPAPTLGVSEQAAAITATPNPEGVNLPSTAGLSAPTAP